jgi:hypothetical protein
MNPQACGLTKGFVADITFVTFFTMDFLVQLQVCTTVKRFSTGLTFIYFVTIS